jgi:hypothetical protein
MIKRFYYQIEAITAKGENGEKESSSKIRGPVFFPFFGALVTDRRDVARAKWRRLVPNRHQKPHLCGDGSTSGYCRMCPKGALYVNSIDKNILVTKVEEKAA